MKVRFFTKIAVFVLALAAGDAVFAQASWPCGATANDKVTATLNAEGVLTVRGTGKMMERVKVVKLSEQALRQKRGMYEQYMRDCYRRGGSEMECESSAKIASMMYGLNETTETVFVPMPWADYEKAITKVVIENGVTSIGSGTFFKYTNMTSITIGKSVTDIGYGAFSYCLSLTSITIPNSVKTIGNFAFNNCTNLTSVTIPDNLISIDDDVFIGCERLESITIPNRVKTIGDRTFKGCLSLTSITIPNSIKTIGEGAFEECIGLRSITIPNSVESIGDRAFFKCEGLVSITISNRVSFIGKEVFDSSGVAFITMLNPTPPKIDEATFKGVNKGISKPICILFVPEGSLYKMAEGWKKFQNIRFGIGTEEVIQAELHKQEQERNDNEAELQRKEAERQRKEVERRRADEVAQRIEFFNAIATAFGDSPTGLAKQRYELNKRSTTVEEKFFKEKDTAIDDNVKRMSKGDQKAYNKEFKRLEKGEGIGARSRASIERVVRQNMAALRYAYSQHLRHVDRLAKQKIGYGSGYDGGGVGRKDVPAGSMYGSGYGSGFGGGGVDDDLLGGLMGRGGGGLDLKKRGGDGSGKIVVEFAIDQSGRVLSAHSVESTMKAPEFEDTVVSMVKSWNFESINAPGDVTIVIYPFEF